MKTKKKIYVCMGIDVEEEGLFSGRYSQANLGLANVPLLSRLAFLYDEFGIPLTLFCAWPVFKDKNCQETLEYLHFRCGSEIGAHLHHWNTPPLIGIENLNGAPPSENVPQEVMEQKIANLLETGRQCLGRPITSFRMGRWDLTRRLLPVLYRNGIKVDSSICPLRFFRNGPDHFLAPAKPYWVDLDARQRILEAPITQLPLFSPLASIWRTAFSRSPRILDTFHFFGAISANPVWHSPAIMRVTALLAANATGILNLFWHSSELMPGGSPNIPDQAAADALIAKIGAFANWLREQFAVVPVTASQLAEIPPAVSYPILATPTTGDW